MIISTIRIKMKIWKNRVLENIARPTQSINQTINREINQAIKQSINRWNEQLWCVFSYRHHQKCRNWARMMAAGRKTSRTATNWQNSGWKNSDWKFRSCPWRHHFVQIHCDHCWTRKTPVPATANPLDGYALKFLHSCSYTQNSTTKLRKKIR